MFSGKVYHPEPPHAQSLFLFPIVFGIILLSILFFPIRSEVNSFLPDRQLQSGSFFLNALSLSLLLA